MAPFLCVGLVFFFFLSFCVGFPQNVKKVLPGLGNSEYKKVALSVTWWWRFGNEKEDALSRRVILLLRIVLFQLGTCQMWGGKFGPKGSALWQGMGMLGFGWMTRWVWVLCAGYFLGSIEWCPARSQLLVIAMRCRMIPLCGVFPLGGTFDLRRTFNMQSYWVFFLKCVFFFCVRARARIPTILGFGSILLPGHSQRKPLS